MEIATQLLSWYDQNARPLPWRGNHDPYIIWVSEIIFQQTRIEQGTGYYLRFVARFPTLASLASADEDEVLRLWQGLGYYSRARNMLYTARLIQDQMGGKFPDVFDSIRTLKGIGDYTASCIASICFNQVHAAVDGNVYRVLSRLFAEFLPIDSPAGKRRFKQLAQELISADRPGDFNEAMMDLGATICKPRLPMCPDCPLKDFCRAHKMMRETEFPLKKPAKKNAGSILNYFLVQTGDQILIRKRQGKGIWEGMYELPMLEGDLDQDSLVAECRELWGITADSPSEIYRIKHQLSHKNLDIRFYSLRNAGYKPDETTLLSVTKEEISSYPFPKPLADFLETLPTD